VQLAAVVPAASWPWIALIAAIALLLVLDLAVMKGRGGVMSLRGAVLASAFWVSVALVFFLILIAVGDSGGARAFMSGYLVEKSLSLDNVFVFVLVLGAFAVPMAERHRLLTYGIIGALAFRAVFIVVGAAALSEFAWLNLLLAAILVATGWRMWRHRHDDDSERALVEAIRRRLPISDSPPAGRLARRENGGTVLTASGAALVAIGAVDIILAVDSVPAILAITSDAYIVFAANAFALLGLRPLFFFVAELADRLYYLKAALSALLVFIGAKMAAAQFVGKLGPEITLPIIAVILGAGVIASLVRRHRLARLVPASQEV
jgi:tellurite resistance protein TerC